MPGNEQHAFLEAHPDVYEHSHGAVRLRIHGGRHRAGLARLRRLRERGDARLRGDDADRLALARLGLVADEPVEQRLRGNRQAAVAAAGSRRSRVATRAC